MTEYNDMTEEQKNQFIKEFINFFGSKLPNPTHYPMAFEFYIQMYKQHLRTIKNDKMV